MRGVNRASALHRRFAGLAFAAALLLALMPSLTRIVSAASAAAAMPDLTALCTHAGLQYVDAGAHHHDGGGARPAHDADGDCAYCPLLAHGALPQAVAAFAAHAPLPAQRPLAHAAAVAHEVFSIAARPRGPPHAFAA